MSTSHPMPDRYFAADPAQRSIAKELYAQVKDLPLVCPHGHVPPALLADPNARFPSPVELFVIPDHYVLRMLYSQGLTMEELGVPTRDGTPVETDHRRIWQKFADHFYLFRGTPTGLWLRDELIEVFGVDEKLTDKSAMRIYDYLEEQLQKDEYSPRALFKRFNVETLCTTDAATDTLEHHRSLKDEGWGETIRPTFRPDAVIQLNAQGWRENIDLLSSVSGIDIVDYKSYIQALEQRRAFFKEMGATATDHAAVTPAMEALEESEAARIFDRALQGKIDPQDAQRFGGHMLMEMARMSVEDGLVMQLHIGSYRNHNQALFERFGPDQGADIPIQTEWTRSLQPLLNTYGNHPNFRAILFTLDESTYSRELAPLAGHYPALRLGPPWWFFDSILGMQRYLDRVIETAGVYNTAGFNDDTRAFASIPARHDMWRRVTSNWVAGLVTTGVVDEEDAQEMVRDFAYNLAKKAYNLP